MNQVIEIETMRQAGLDTNEIARLLDLRRKFEWEWRQEELAGHRREFVKYLIATGRIHD